MNGLASSMKNIVVVGGSYVGWEAARNIAKILPPTHRVILIEPHSHFHHLFAFPRFAVAPGHEHKAFVPYDTTFSSSPRPEAHQIVQAHVLSVQPDHVKLDRKWQISDLLPYEYLAIATGTRLAQPAGIEHDEKSLCVEYLQNHQKAVKAAKSIVIAGGGAVGVQLSTDLKEIYPEKKITLVHSRTRVMHQFIEELHDIVKARCDKLGVDLITSSRVIFPPLGFPKDKTPFDVELTTGRTLKADLVIRATGQSPNNSLMRDLDDLDPGSVINPANGYIKVKPTLQLANPKYPNILALGDIADTGAHKAARPGCAQAEVLAENIQSLLEGGKEPLKEIQIDPPAIHLTLGIKDNVIFCDPDKSKGHTEPEIWRQDDGQEDLDVEGQWTYMEKPVDNPRQYHL